MGSQLLYTGDELKVSCSVLNIIQIEKEKIFQLLRHTEIGLWPSKGVCTKMDQVFLQGPVKGQWKAMCYEHTKACWVFQNWAEWHVPSFKNLIIEMKYLYMNFPAGCFFPLCQFQHDCHSIYFPDIIWSNCGCCFAFLRCSLTSPPTPLPVLCHTGITIQTLASTPHLSKPSGKYSLPWITI